MVKHSYKPYSYLFLGAILVPGIIISEPPVPLATTQHLPVEILFSGITPLNNSSSVLLRIQGKSADVFSSCEGTKTVVSENSTSTLLQWKPVGNCLVPIITVAKKNYVIPMNGYFPDELFLSNVSSETLRNTIKAAAIMKSDYRLATGQQIRDFFTTIEYILAAREQKFSMPIAKAILPTKATFLPNSPRPYRAKETDGVHHGWDFYTKKGTPVVAIQDGTVIHVKRDFSWKEMDNLLPVKTDLQKQENLDTYRGNTVYLKTRSGHVAIYAHLENIPEEIQEGVFVTEGSIVGHVGDSAVPDKAYLYHLHFELAMNPFKDIDAGNVGFKDILLWPYFGKGKTADWIRANDDLLFN